MIPLGVGMYWDDLGGERGGATHLTILCMLVLAISFGSWDLLEPRRYALGGSVCEVANSASCDYTDCGVSLYDIFFSIIFETQVFDSVT